MPSIIIGRSRPDRLLRSEERELLEESIMESPTLGGSVIGGSVLGGSVLGGSVLGGSVLEREPLAVEGEPIRLSGGSLRYPYERRRDRFMRHLPGVQRDWEEKYGSGVYIRRDYVGGIARGISQFITVVFGVLIQLIVAIVTPLLVAISSVGRGMGVGGRMGMGQDVVVDDLGMRRYPRRRRLRRVHI